MIHAEIKSKEKEDISILITADNHAGKYLCDCGFASDLSVKDCQDITVLFISHTHIDHFINFDHILRNQLGIQKEVIICGPKGIAQQVQSRIKGYTWNLIKEGAISYQIREIISPEEIRVFNISPPMWELVELSRLKDENLYYNKEIKVDFTILDHGIPSIAYLFQEHDKVNINMRRSKLSGGPWVNELKKAFISGNHDLNIKIKDQEYKVKDLSHLLSLQKGYKLGVIMDHDACVENHNKIRNFFAGADTILIESFYKAEDIELAKNNLHSYSKASAKIMRETGVKKAIPIHFSRRYESEDIKQLLQEFENEWNKK